MLLPLKLDQEINIEAMIQVEEDPLTKENWANALLKK
jgi:hypothetical protein